MLFVSSPACFFLRVPIITMYYYIRWRMGDEFVENCRRGVLFYVAVMPPLACLIVVLSLLDLYHEGNFSIRLVQNKKIGMINSASAPSLLIPLAPLFLRHLLPGFDCFAFFLFVATPAILSCSAL